MGPTENDQQAAPGAGTPADGGAMPPAQPTPPAGGADQNAAWPPAPPAGTDPMAGAGAPNPEEVGMGDEASATAPETPVSPAAPAEPAAPAPDAGVAPPNDPSAGMPGATPQQ